MPPKQRTKRQVLLQNSPSTGAPAWQDVEEEDRTQLGDGAANILAPALRDGMESLFAAMTDTDSRIVLCPDNPALVRINSGLDIHPRRLAEIPEAGRKELLQAYRTLELAGGRGDQMAPDDRDRLDRITGSKGFRLRSEYHRARARQLLDELGITALPAAQQRIFVQMTNADRDRLFDLVNERPPNAARDLRRQATAYALLRSGSVREFVEFYQVYATEFLNRARSRITVYHDRVAVEVAAATTAAGGTPPNASQLQAIQNRVKDDLGIRRNAEHFYYGQVLEEMSARGEDGTVDTTRPSAASIADVNAAYQRRVTNLPGPVGGVHVDVTPDLSNVELVRRLQALPDITFGSESAAAYHVAKHYSELPAGARTAAEAAGRSDVDTYLASAHDTIANMAGADLAEIVTTSQDGTGRSVRFAHNGMIAIVHVRNDGHAVLATHMGGR